MAHQMTETPFDISLLHKGISLRPRQIVHREEAQSLVELALMMPLFILLLLGTTEFARFAWAAVLTASAARAGAQYGCQNAATAADTAGIQAYAASDSVNLTGLTTTSSVSCYCSTAASTQITCSTALGSCAAPATILAYVQVNTTSTVTPLGRYPGLPTSFTATGKSIMVVEQ
jgi:Flp pilus assembly protein TadG